MRTATTGAPRSTHVRLSAQAHSALRVYANRRGLELAAAAAVLIEEWLYGRDHVRAVAPRTRKADASAGQVYVIRYGEYCKIGKAKNAHVRIRRLKLPVADDVVLIADVPDRHTAERDLHKRFAAKRAAGEWFRLSADDISGISREFEGTDGKDSKK